MPRIRLLSYNTHALRDDVRAVVGIVRTCQPHVLCAQEVPRFVLWRSRRRRLARAVGMRPATNRRAGGLAVFVSPEVTVVAGRHHVLRRYPGLHTRAVAIAVVEVVGRRLAIACTHLDLTAGARLAHAAEAVQWLHDTALSYSAVPVLAGDINEEPGGPSWELLTEWLRDSAAAAPWGETATVTSRHPRKRIDAVFTAPELPVVRAGVPAHLFSGAECVAASDHRPVLADLAVPETVKRA